jgi:hypothetical protein
MSFWCHRFDQNCNENIVRISALTFFVASWGLSGSFLGPTGYRKPQKASRKPNEAIRNFMAEIIRIFSLLFWSK